MHATFRRVVMRRSADGLWVADVPPPLYALSKSGAWRGPVPVPLLTRRHGAVPDYCETLCGIVVLSAAMRDILETELNDDVEFLPTTRDGVASDLQVMHVATAVDCVDRDRSEFELWKPEDRRPDRTGQFRHFERLVLKRDLVPEGVRAFRLWGSPVDLFIEESIARKMAAPPFTGVGLYEHEHS